jgi:uncharacterized integral membrane protein
MVSRIPSPRSAVTRSRRDYRLDVLCVVVLTLVLLMLFAVSASAISARARVGSSLRGASKSLPGP